MTSPIVKWVGGKRQLVPELLKYVPDDFNDYYEPFAGGAALFFALQTEAGCAKPVKAHLNDANPHLMNVYQQIRDNVEEVIRGLKYEDTAVRVHGLKDAYATIRNNFNENDPGAPPWVQASRFLALNAWGFNGLCRYNKSGGFNVPVGKFAKTPVLMDKAENLRNVSKALRGVEITCGDFAKAVKGAKCGDLVYFDPPYIPKTATADFTSYTADGFDGDDQKRLLVEADVLIHRGVHVIISNSDTPHTRKLLEHIPGRSDFWSLHEVQARRAVNCKATKRGKVGELIIVGNLGR